MKVHVDGKIYEVKWKHDANKIYPDISSTCFICYQNVVILTGVAFRSKHDNMNYNKGRKVSLANALKKFDRPLRRPFWIAYFNMRMGKY